MHHQASFAKINLFLYVTGRRSDGFHDLFSLMTRITLADDMAFAFHGDGVHVTCDHPKVPADTTNLAHRAAVLFFESCKKLVKPISLDGVTIHIDKKIPVGSGLGGGSSNAATVLMVLNQFCQNPFSRNALMKMGLCLGADIPFFLFGGPALATGVGETLIRAENPGFQYVVLCDPGIHVPTARVFKTLDFCLTSHQKYTIKSASDALLRGQKIDIRHYGNNDLEASAFRLYPEIKTTKDEMVRLLQRPVSMSGSGGSLFALYSEQNNAKQGYEMLCRRWPGGEKKIFLTAMHNG